MSAMRTRRTAPEVRWSSADAHPLVRIERPGAVASQLTSREARVLGLALLAAASDIDAEMRRRRGAGDLTRRFAADAFGE